MYVTIYLMGLRKQEKFEQNRLSRYNNKVKSH